MPRNSAPARAIVEQANRERLIVDLDGYLVGGQFRSRTLQEMLEIVKPLAEQAGVTRLGELTHLDRLGFPVFQAIRPSSRSLSTAMGRGSTRRAAIVSALLEAIETDVAEKVAGSRAGALSDLDGRTLEIWNSSPRDPLAVCLDPAIDRQWVEGIDLETGQSRLVPLDLVSQDLTLPAMPDTLMSTVGLASGGSRDEALASALTELLEHDLETDWRLATPSERRQCEIDLASVNESTVRHALRLVQNAGCEVRLWSLGQERRIAAILCLIIDGRSSPTMLSPVKGGGCHPDRTIATLRAIQEAAQARCALISGARDDLSVRNYEYARKKSIEALLASLCLGPGPLNWNSVPNLSRPDVRSTFELAACVARSRSDLPLIAVDLPSPHPALHITKVAAPGLRLSERGDLVRRTEPEQRIVVSPVRSARKILFAGPSLGQIEVPSGIEVRPPAIAKDFARLLDDPPVAVGLVDGCFETAPTVWHKEILDLLSAGVAVIGAASLGALRAAELHRYGMIGVGAIFESFRNEAVVRDDAVLLVHAPAELDHMPLSLSLVEAEAAILQLCRDEGERRTLQRIVRTMSFRDRTWARIMTAYRTRAGRHCSVSERDFLSVPSIKQADVRLLLNALSVAGSSWLRPRPPLTVYYRRLLSQI